MRREPMCNTTKSQQTTREQEKKNREKLQNSQKTMNKMAVSAYLLIITLNVYGLIIQ